MKALRVQKTKVVATPEDFSDWEWGQHPKVDGLINHIRVSAAEVIKEQIEREAEGRFLEWSGLFNVEIWPNFEISFDVLAALAEGEIEFDDLDQLVSFHARIQAVADNLKKAIGLAAS